VVDEAISEGRPWEWQFLILAVYRPWFRWTFVMFSLRKDRICICIGRSVSFRLPRAKKKWKRLIHAPNGSKRLIQDAAAIFRRASMGAFPSCCGTVVNPTDWKMCSRLHRVEGRKWEKSHEVMWLANCRHRRVWRVSWSFKVPKKTWLNVYNYLECFISHTYELMNIFSLCLFCFVMLMFDLLLDSMVVGDPPQHDW